METNELPALYVFLDEAGDLGFTNKGSTCFTLTSITTTRPFPWDTPLMDLKYDLLEWGLPTERFHAAEDNGHVKGRVFGIIAGNLQQMRIDAVIVEKRKTALTLQAEDKFYPRILGYLLRFVINHEVLTSFSKVIVMTDTIPVSGKRKAIEKAVKETLAKMLPSGTRYEILHHSSQSCFGLQTADYCCWAIHRKWERGDSKSHALISSAIRSEFDIFRTGSTFYY